MTPAEAAKLLDLPVDATPEQLEARFLDLRRKLEDKVAKAPTPGLQAKYRESLTQITTAFESLTLAADSSTLPVLQRQKTEDGGPKTASGPSTPGGGVPPPRGTSPSSPLLHTPQSVVRTPKSNKEFIIVALIAVAVLAGGGWWVMKTRTENEAKLRLAAELKAEAEHQAQLAREKAEHQAQLTREKAEQDKLAKEAAEKAEKERGEKLFTSLRSRMAELNVVYDALMRSEQTAERELSELKSRERDLAREQKAAPTPELRRLSAQVRAQDRLVGWMRDTLPTHPAKVARAKAEELLSARATDEATPAVANYAQEVDQLKKDIAESRANLAVTGTLNLSANLEGATWQLTDAFGVERSGATPAQLDDVALGKGTLTFRRTGWPDQKYTVDHRPGGGTATGKFPVGALRVTSEPTGAKVYRGNTVIGTTPLEIAQLPPSQIDLRIGQLGFRSQKFADKIEDGKMLALQATLQPSRVVDTEFIMKSVETEIPKIQNPEKRAELVLTLLSTARQMDGMPKALLRRLTDMHLAACQAIPNPRQRLDAIVAASEFTLPAIDFAHSRTWAELAAATILTLGEPEDRKRALSQIGTFAIHPDLQSRMASAMLNRFAGQEEWYNRDNMVRRFAEAGLELEHALTRADSINEYEYNELRKVYSIARQTRLFVPVKIALYKGDVAGARRELDRYTGKLDFEETAAGEFIRLGDPDSARRMGRLAQTESNDPPYTLVFVALNIGNLPLAEQWADALVDGLDRSRAHLRIADRYLTMGCRTEALQAINKVVTFSPNHSLGERYHCALILAQLGETDRARALIRSDPLAFHKDEALELLYAAALYAVLDDPASTERALRVLQAEYPHLFAEAVYNIVQALRQVGRFEEVKGYQARLDDLVDARNQVQHTPDDDLGELIEQTPAGMDRVVILHTILARNLDRQNLARYQR